MISIPLGVGGFTFVYARGYSYLSNDPKACINCHIMRDQFDSWKRSSHHTVAVCNDCHTPGRIHEKYYAKALNGWWHSFAFTTGRFAEPIRIKPSNLERVQRSCVGCHSQILSSAPHTLQDQSCVRCHSSVGHL
ncbi:MAG: cytochrome c nitrite reductase small subunit [Bdellovibrionia bacterium]